jgi:hypothetical protein
MSGLPKLVITLEDLYALFDAALDREDYERAAAFLDAVLSLNDDHDEPADADA